MHVAMTAASPCVGEAKSSTSTPGGMAPLGYRAVIVVHALL